MSYDAVIHILIVDDEIQIREISKEFLEGFENIEVQTAASVREARLAHAKKNFDAIVSDFQMPGEDGISFLRSVRSSGDRTPFILFTGKGREDVVIEALNNGADSYLQKEGDPLSLYTDLVHRIQVAIGKRRAEMEVEQRNQELQRANLELGMADAELRAQIDEIKANNEELRAKDERLSSSEARFANLFENMSSGAAVHAIILDPFGVPYDYRFLDVNRAFEKMTGMTRSKVLGRTVREVLHQVEPIWIERYGRVALTGVADHFESHSAALARDYSVSVYRNEPGQFTTLLLDITERVRSERAQRELSIKYQTLLRTLPIGVTISDEKGNIIESNEEAARLLGLSVEEQKRRSIAGEEWKIVGSDGTPMPPQEFASTRALAEGRTIHNVEMGLVNDGHFTWIDVTAAPVPLEGYGVAIAYVDISKRKASEHDLKERMKELQAFYLLSDLVERKDLDLEDLYQKMVHALPDSLQYSKIAGARIVVDGHEHRTENFKETIWRYAAPIEVHGQAVGFIEAIYLEKRVESDQGAFLKEEERLIRGIAERIGRIIERKRAEVEIRRLSAELQAIFDNTPTMIWYKDTKNNFVRVNQAAAASMGLTADRIEGHSANELFPQDAEAYYRDDLEVMVEGRPKLGIEERLNGGGGGTRWVRTDKIPLRDGIGDITGILVISQDITEQRYAHEALQQSESKFHEIFNNANDAIHLNEYDPDLGPGAIIDINDVGCRLLEHSREELLRMNPRDFTSESHQPSREEVLRLLREYGMAEFKTEHRRRDGRMVPVEINAHVVTMMGRPTVIAVVRDITERKRIEDELRKLARAAENSPACIVITDINGSIEWVNPKFASLTGYSLEEAKGQNPRILKSGETPREEYQRMYQIILGGGTWHGEFHNKKKSGELYWESVSIAPIFDDVGRISHFIASKEDITERKQMESALRAAGHKLNLLSSITRHDINNQMTVLEGNLALLKKSRPQLTSDEHLKKAEKAAGQITAIVQFTKNYEDIGVRAPAWASPGRQTKEDFALMHPVGVELEDDTGGVEILADPLAEKVPYNLIDNSMRHGEHVTRIRMSAERTGDAMLIVYEDDGVGICAEDRKRLFERGFGRNTGLGLFLCREILAITGITITETGKEGEGVRFEMLVPAEAWRRPSMD